MICSEKQNIKLGGRIAQWIAFPLSPQRPQVWFSAFPILLMLPRFIDGTSLLSQWTVEKLNSWSHPSSTTRLYNKKIFSNSQCKFFTRSLSIFFIWTKDSAPPSFFRRKSLSMFWKSLFERLPSIYCSHEIEIYWLLHLHIPFLWFRTLREREKENETIKVERDK